MTMSGCRMKLRIRSTFRWAEYGTFPSYIRTASASNDRPRRIAKTYGRAQWSRKQNERLGDQRHATSPERS
jgi:hypothetical protein